MPKNPFQSILPLIFVGSIIFETSCSPAKTVSRLRNTSSDIFVALFDSKPDAEPTVQVSAPNAVTADICMTGPDGQCDTTASKFPLQEISKVGDRFIYSPKSGPNLASLKDYLIIDRSGLELFRFRLALKNQGGSLDAGLGQFALQTIKDELTFITQDKFEGRLSATRENDEIADYLIAELKKLNIKPVFGDNYRQQFKMPNGPTAGKATNNIIGLIEGSDPVLKNEYVVIGAHMDHTGTLDRGYTCNGGSGDVICNGADDNGSGTIAVLNVAKALAASRGMLKRSVLIMWFSGEEEGLVGSKYYVANPAIPLKNHVFMVNLDMVGYSKSFGDAIAAIGTVTSKWADKTARELSKKYPSHKLRFTEKVEGGSDHAPFMNNGIPGIFYHTGVSNNPNYHRTTDHVDKVDFDGMLVAGKLAYETVMAAGMTSELSSQTGMSLVGVKKFVSDADASKGCHYLMDYKYID